MRADQCDAPQGAAGVAAPARIKLVTTTAGVKGTAFAKSIASGPELLHIRTRAKSPGQNGIRERGFGCLKYEHLCRHASQRISPIQVHAF